MFKTILSKFIIIFLSISLLHCVKPQNINFNKNTSIKIEKNIYIDDKFNEEEIEYIIESIAEWEEKSNNIIKFNIKTVFNIQDSKKINNPNKSIVIEKTHSSDINVYFLEAVVKTTLLGYCDKNNKITNIIIVYNRLESKEIYKSVVMHEIGHALGLMHVNTKFTMMYPFVDYTSYHLTYEDMKQFCNIYNCNVEDLHINE